MLKVADEGYRREAERDIKAGLEMARFLLQLSDEDFTQYRQHDLHIIPRGAWVRLTGEEQKLARAKGMVSRTDDYEMHTGAPLDETMISDASQAAVIPDQDGEEESENETGAKCAPIESLAQDERTWYVVRQVVDIIIASPNARLQAECFRIASGMGELDDITETSVARKHGLTRAAVSKRCVRLTKLVGMRPSRYMCSMQLRDTYRKARVRSLEKRKEESPSH